MFVSGLTVFGEDLFYETAIQEFDGDPARRTVREYELKMREKRLKAALAYQNLVGPETRSYENLQLGALAAYLVRRGLDDRNEQASRANELVKNELSAAVVNNCISLTLVTTEYLTIASVQNRGIRLVDADYINGKSDPIYDALGSSKLDPIEFIAAFNEVEATVLAFRPRERGFDYDAMGAVAGS